MMPDFDAYEFLRRFEAGELDADLCHEIDDLSQEQLEQLAFVLAGKLRRKTVGAAN